MEHGYIGQTKSKAKPKQFIEGTIIPEYIRQRDMLMLNDIFVSNETKEIIILKYGL